MEKGRGKIHNKFRTFLVLILLAVLHTVVFLLQAVQIVFTCAQCLPSVSQKENVAVGLLEIDPPIFLQVGELIDKNLLFPYLLVQVLLFNAILWCCADSL